jgi:hypothetical protein
MKNPVGKIAGGVLLFVFMLFGISSCNLFGENRGGEDCPVGGCVGNPDDMETDYEPLVP